jgi:hypothetical protein
MVIPRPEQVMMFDEHTSPNQASAEPPAAGSPATSPGVARFHTCRWHEPGDATVQPHCTHRDVLPMAGTTGFNMDAWCTECAFYKLRRNPRKPPIA